MGTKIKAVVVDCDGTLTDGSVWFSEDGDILRQFSTLDGQGFKLLKYNLGSAYIHILTGSTSNAIKARAEWLDIPCATSQDKTHWLRMYSDYTGIPLEHICVMGNDVIDLGAMKLCGFPACPHDAHDDVLELCYSQGYVSMRHGGHGAFRELVDYLIGNKFIV